MSRLSLGHYQSPFCNPPVHGGVDLSDHLLCAVGREMYPVGEIGTGLAECLAFWGQEVDPQASCTDFRAHPMQVSLQGGPLGLDRKSVV